VALNQLKIDGAAAVLQRGAAEYSGKLCGWSDTPEDRNEKAETYVKYLFHPDILYIIISDKEEKSQTGREPGTESHGSCSQC
jgi:hypothetical protein